MAVYTDITDADLDAFLADYDLGRPLAFKGIAEGVSNSNFLLETEQGRFILTIYEKTVDAGDLPYFLGLMRWLADAGFPSAAPVPGRDGEALRHIAGKPAALATFLTGLSVRRPGMAQCREAGIGLAWLHQAALAYPRRRANTWGQGVWAAAFQSLADLPQGTIHADFFPDNVFFRNGAFAAAIDFYYACSDQLAYDVGICLNAWCFEPDGSFNVTKAQAFLAGYEQRRPLSDAERAAIPILAHGAAMRFFLSRLVDWAKPDDGALVRHHDPLEYERKLAVHRAGVELFGTAS
jgi:homoserine kinase type II